MKVLLGTPVHESKDYAMDKWMASIAVLDYPFDLLLVDNSADLEYVNKLHHYCKKYGIIRYRLVHIDVGNHAVLDERLAQSREIIRQEVLAKGYDAWCSLECDVIAPPDALSKLVALLDDYWMVSHGYPSRGNPNGTNAELGIALVTRGALEKIDFIHQYGFVDPLRPDCNYGNDVWFIRRIDRQSGGKYIHVYGVITPIYHLAH